MKSRCALLLAALLSMLLLLAACQGKTQGSEPWLAYQQQTGFCVQAELTCNLGQRVSEYTVLYERPAAGADRQSILAPEEVAGIVMTLDGSEQTVVSYEETQLESAMPEKRGLTPADGIYYLLETLKNEFPDTVSEETYEQTPVVRASYRTQEELGEVGREILLTPEGQLVYAEVALEGERILALRFSDFTWTE